jgi:thiamine biosynthesis lipoprotein
VPDKKRNNSSKEIHKEQPTTSLIYLTMVFFTKAVDSLLADIDGSMSTWIPTSIISRINNNEENVIVDDYFKWF